MRRHLLLGVSLLGVVLWASTGYAQTRTTIRGTVIENAPIYLSPDPSLVPLRRAAAGTVLEILTDEGQWMQVRFQDPQLGLRVGYIESRVVQQVAMDLSLPSADTERAVPSVVDGVAPAAPSARLPQTQTRLASLAEAQDKSRSEGFFVGGGLEGVGVVTEVDSSTGTESGSGAGLVVGYGFTPRWALYVQLSGASINSIDFDGTYGLGHFDVGARVHFRAPAKRVVPFVQFGLGARALRLEAVNQYLGHDTLESSGGTGVFGAGFNAHFNPSVAFSMAAVWAVGNMGNTKVNGRATYGDSFRVTTARVSLGIVWFP